MSAVSSNFAQTWWGKRWIEAVQSMSASHAARLPRGIPYASDGLVTELKVSNGKAEALVAGRRNAPYKVSLQLRVLTPPQWGKVFEMLGDRAAFTASLLAGELPEGVCEVFEQCGLSLFPRRQREIRASCSCPDWAGLCKHIAAVHYVLGDSLDKDPFLLLQLRGKTRDEVLEALRTQRSGEDIDDEPRGPGNEHLGVALRQNELSNFYKQQDDFADFRFHIARPELPLSLLRRLGPPPFWGVESPIESFLAELIERASECAEQLGMVEGENGRDENTTSSRQEALASTTEEPRRSTGPIGIVAVVDGGESQGEESKDGPKVLVRRVSRETKQNAPRSRGNKKTRREESSAELAPPSPSSGSDPAIPRLSRRVAPGTTDASAPSVEDRLELLLPLTEAIPDGPAIARQIIWALKTHGSATARQLARRTRMKKAAILVLLQSLVTVNLVLQEGQGERARFSVGSS
jgi:uncharacterized Zn finger protein